MGLSTFSLGGWMIWYPPKSYVWSPYYFNPTGLKPFNIWTFFIFKIKNEMQVPTRDCQIMFLFFLILEFSVWLQEEMPIRCPQDKRATCGKGQCSKYRAQVATTAQRCHTPWSTEDPGICKRRHQCFSPRRHPITQIGEWTPAWPLWEVLYCSITKREHSSTSSSWIMWRGK